MEEAKLLGEISLSEAGGGKCLLGDLDGDGLRLGKGKILHAR